VFTPDHQRLREMGSFPSANRFDEQVQRSVEEEENIAGVVNTEVHALVYSLSAHFSAPYECLENVT